MPKEADNTKYNMNIIAIPSAIYAILFSCGASALILDTNTKNTFTINNMPAIRLGICQPTYVNITIIKNNASIAQNAILRHSPDFSFFSPVFFSIKFTLYDLYIIYTILF